MRLISTTFACSALALMLTGAGGFAHSVKQGTEPADGAVLATPPDAIEMQFNEPMRITAITLRDATGTEHALTRSDDMQPAPLFRARPAADLPPGLYAVEWRGLAQDGHAMQGGFSFEIKP